MRMTGNFEGGVVMGSAIQASIDHIGMLCSYGWSTPDWLVEAR